MAQPKLTLFVDIISPFAYLAFYAITHDATFKGVDVDFVPVFLGGIMQDTGNRPPITIKNKGQYLARQQDKWAKQFNVPWADSMPSPFPQPTLYTGRALCAIKQKYPAKLNDAIAAFYHAFFVDLKTVGKPEVISDILSKVLSKQEVEDVLALVQQTEVKQQLLENTKYALDNGCFGLPHFIATNAQGDKATFWGFDHLGQVVEQLGIEKKGEGFRSML